MALHVPNLSHYLKETAGLYEQRGERTCIAVDEAIKANSNCLLFVNP